VCFIEIEKNDMGEACRMYGGGEVYTGLWWGNLKEGEHLEDPGVEVEDNIKMDLLEEEWEGVCTRLIWLGIGTDGGHF
jgi:hypothetical protein